MYIEGVPKNVTANEVTMVNLNKTVVNVDKESKGITNQVTIDKTFQDAMNKPTRSVPLDCKTANQLS